MFLVSFVLVQQLISCDFEVGPISGAVRKLSEVSGVPLSVEGVAKNETVFLHVDSRPLQEVLDKLARVTTSQWNPNGNGGYTLIRPQSLIRRAEEIEFQQRLANVKKWQSQGPKPNDYEEPLVGDLVSGYVTAYKENLKAKPGYRSSKPAKYIEAALLLPLYLECRNRIDLAKIAQLRHDQRVVFSSSPTPRQTAFTQPIASKLNRSLGLLRKRLNEAGIRAKSVPVDPRKYEYSTFTGGQSNETLPFARPIKSVVLSFNYTSYDRILAIMSLLDDKRHVVAASLCDQFKASIPKDQPAIKLPEIESAFPLPSTLPTRAFRQASQESWRKKPGDPSNPEISQALAPFFIDPINNDFLKLGNQEFFSMLGPTTKRSIVACIPDGQQLRYEETSVKRFVEAKIGESSSSTVSENWIEFFPSNPVNHWGSRGNREALARCAKTWRARGKMEMRNVTQLLSGDAQSYPNIEEFAQLIMPAARNNHYNSQAAYTIYRGMGELLGSLTEPQIERLRHGSIIPYRELSKPQRGYCEAIVYGVPFHRVIGGDAISWEPTIELPNGLNDKVGITAKVIDEHYLVAHDPEEPPYDDIRETMELDERPERFNGAVLGCGNYAQANRWMKFDFRTRKRFALRCYLTKGHYYSVDYYEPISPDKGQRLTVDQLSPDLVAHIKKENRAFYSRAVRYIGPDGKTWVRTERYQEPKKKKKK